MGYNCRTFEAGSDLQDGGATSEHLKPFSSACVFLNVAILHGVERKFIHIKDTYFQTVIDVLALKQIRGATFQCSGVLLHLSELNQTVTGIRLDGRWHPQLQFCLDILLRFVLLGDYVVFER